METHEAKNPTDLFKVLGEMMKPEAKNVQRPLYEIAAEIRKDWGVKINLAARPYISAMSSMSTMEEGYFCDSGYSIIAYFLNNSIGWRGDTARRIKRELRDIAKIK